MIFYSFALNLCVSTPEKKKVHEVKKRLNMNFLLSKDKITDAVTYIH